MSRDENFVLYYVLRNRLFLPSNSCTVINRFSVTYFLSSMRGVFAERLFNRQNILFRDLFYSTRCFEKNIHAEALFSSRAWRSRRIHLEQWRHVFSSPLSSINQYQAILLHKHSSLFQSLLIALGTPESRKSCADHIYFKCSAESNHH